MEMPMPEIIDAVFKLLVVLMLAGAGWLLAKWKWTGDRVKLLAAGVEIAYGAVNELAAKTDNKVDDKAAEALKQLALFLEGYGQKPPTLAESNAAKVQFNAMHAEERAAVNPPVAPTAST